MSRCGWAAVALTVLSLTRPAAAQPFADTPANHWAYAALAALAAKGLLAGYPDATFMRDHAMSRYEMATVVGRLLARLNDRQSAVAALPGPPLTKADVDLVLRLLREFQVELAAQGVRLARVEEELNVLNNRLDRKTIRITGAAEFRYDIGARRSSGSSLNGNPKTGTVSAGASPGANLARYAMRLGFDATVTDDLHFILVLLTSGNSGFQGGGFVAFNSSDFGVPGTFSARLGIIDNAFLDWRKPAGMPVEIWLGRFGGVTIGPTYPVQFGPLGLLLNTNGSSYANATGGFPDADGLRVMVHLAALADLQFQAVAIRIIGNGGATSYPSGEDAYGVDANLALSKDLRVGAYYVGNSITQSGSTPFSQPPGAVSFLYHVYGMGTLSINPPTDHCPVTTDGVTGITCPAAGHGVGAYVQWTIGPGIHLDAEWAQWTDAVLGGTDNGYRALVTWNLGELFKVGHKFTVSTGYAYYGPNFYPPYGTAEVFYQMTWDQIIPGNSQGFTISASAELWPHVFAYVNYATGQNVSNQMPLAGYQIGLIYELSPAMTVSLRYIDNSLGGIDQQNEYRTQLDYRF